MSNEDNGTNTSNFFTRHKVLTGLFIALLAIIGWWKVEFPSATWRYKLTVTVETPEGLKTGYAVREVSGSAQPGLMGVEAKVYHKVKGEAVVVDLGHDKYLFALMDVDGSYRAVRDTFPFSSVNDGDYVRYYASLKAGPTKVLPANVPTLVTFKDIKDPKTVTQVDPNNLAATFGAGVTLKDVIIEMTDEDVTREVDKYLTSEFWKNFDIWWKTLTVEDKSIKASLFNFKTGE
jgi:hypothetical protein